MRAALSLGLAILAAVSVAAAVGKAAQPNSTQAASGAERAREIGLLGLGAMRRGADGQNPAAPNAANYDEATANPYPLPDPLAGAGGRRVATPAQWWSVRRPQILKAMDEALYGKAPARTPRVDWTVKETRRETLFGVPAVSKLLDGRLDNAAFPAVEVHIQALLVAPEAAVTARRKTPVILSIDFARRPPGLPADPGVDYRRQILERGWSYVVFDPTTVQADNGAGLTSGVIGLVNRGKPRSLDDWGVLRAWAWGASRILDRLAVEPNADASKVAIFGHSRYGKAALVAMAYDRRFATGFISSSGAGGAAPYRRHWGEQIENVAAANEFHWMAGNFLKYAADPLTANDLPVDANAVIAMVAPRPIFIGAGRSTTGAGLPSSDGWVDPPGMFKAEASAGQVWRLLGKRPLGGAAPPMMSLADSGDMAFRQHDQGHTPGPNWSWFLDFAARAFAAN